MTAARKRLAELDQERRRVARGYVTGAIRDELAREEQARIKLEMAQAQRVLATTEIVYSRIEDTLEKVLALVGRCDEAYRQGGPRVRRLSNQFFFEQLRVVSADDGAEVIGGRLMEARAALLSSQWR